MPLNRTPPLTRSKTAGVAPVARPVAKAAESKPSPSRETGLDPVITGTSRIREETPETRPLLETEPTSPETEPTSPSTMSDQGQMMPEEVASLLSELARNHREVHNFVCDIEPLALDGSNMAAWKRWTETAIFDMTGVQSYWTASPPDPDSRLDMLVDKCASRVIYSTIHLNLKNLVGGLSLAHDRMAKLCGHFKQGGRVAQFAIFKSLISKVFDPTRTELMTHINEVISNVDRLESEGFVFTKDNFIGMLFQSGAPLTGEYGMDSVNNTLDAQYRVTGIQPTSEDVRSAMQSMITSRRIVQSNDDSVNVMAASFRRRMSLGRPERFGPQGTGGSRPSMLSPGSGRSPMFSWGSAPGPITPRSDREATESAPLDIPKEARLEVHQRIPQCFHCGEFGHWVPDCSDKTRNKPRRGLHWNDWRKLKNNFTYSIDVLYPSRFGSKGGANPSRPFSVKEVTVSEATVDFSRSEASEAEYARDCLLDSGATHTVSNERDRFVNFKLLPFPLTLHTAAEGAKAKITGVGSLKLSTREGGVVLLNDVYFCKDVSGTLVSLGDLAEKGANFSFCGLDCVIQLSPGFSLLARFCDRRWWISGDAVNGGDVVICNTELSSNEKLLRLWHERFGHVDMKRVRKLCLNQMGMSLPKSLPHASFVCEDCLACKSVRRRTLGRTGRELGLLEVIVSDVMGPFREDLKGARYVITFRDISTSYSEVVIIKLKSEVPDVFLAVISRWERETDSKIKCVRTDGGGEYMKSSFNKWLEGRGIIHELSNPYEPEQNGVAERLNRTLGDMARTMLKASTLPQDFWSLAYAAACYLHNRLPNKITGDKTPYELFYKRRPQLDNIRKFGAIAFIHRHGEQRDGKLADRGRRVRMVGYIKGGKGWLFYDPASKELVRSAIARFPYEEAITKTSDHAVDESGTSSASLNRILNVQEKKGGLNFILNALKLGDFTSEAKVDEQEKSCDIFANGVNLDQVLEAPKSYAEAMKSHYAKEWREAMDVEMAMMRNMSVWRVVDKPVGVDALGVRWVYTYKRLDERGFPVKFKARLVAQGFKQQEGVDFTETFAPTATFASLRVLLSIAAHGRFPVHSFDVTAAYLHSDLDKKLYVKLPPGEMMSERKKGKVLEVVKALYGTKQGGRCWWKHFENVLRELGFSVSQYDQSVYVMRRGDDFVLIWAHVDDGGVVGSREEILEEVAEKLVERLRIRWARSLEHIVGVDVKRFDDGSFKLTQPGLTRKTLAKFLETGNGVRMPLDPKDMPVSGEEGDEKIDSTTYLSAIGMLNYLSVATRPDITYATNVLARFSSAPTKKHWLCVQRVLRYLKGTEDCGLMLQPTSSDKSKCLETFVDANWGGEFSRSVHGYVSYFLGCPVSWTSKRQSCVATSTCHAEYMGLGTAARELVWLKRLVEDVMGDAGPGILRCDNLSAIHVAKNNSSNKRTRHVDREFFYVNEQIYKGLITLHWVDAKNQRADVLTKALGPSLFERGRRELGVC